MQKHGTGINGLLSLPSSTTYYAGLPKAVLADASRLPVDAKRTGILSWRARITAVPSPGNKNNTRSITLQNTDFKRSEDLRYTHHIFLELKSVGLHRLIIVECLNVADIFLVY